MIANAWPEALFTLIPPREKMKVPSFIKKKLIVSLHMFDDACLHVNVIFSFLPFSSLLPFFLVLSFLSFSSHSFIHIFFYLSGKRWKGPFTPKIVIIDAKCN